MELQFSKYGCYDSLLPIGVSQPGGSPSQAGLNNTMRTYNITITIPTIQCPGYQTLNAQTINVQLIAQQCAFNALLRPVVVTLIKRTGATLLITQPCHVN
ncbi:hypothetical protein T01_57 [Trichinella spiralis]|uniref:Uncharacterized protein n=1 Tax=Trichinella spiralis TaxID=6334 RepID=A0A0V1BFN5_TRISP|nr:hypothetical protein T01_57 [Trichinella spiralis]